MIPWIKYISKLFFINVVFGCSYFFGQTSIDSLKHVLAADHSPRTNLDALGELIMAYMDSDLDSALFYCDQYNSLAIKLDDSDQIAKSYFYYTSIYGTGGNYQQLSTYAYPALEHFRSNEDAQGQIDILVILARMNGAKSEFEKAYSNYEEALQLAENNDYYDALVMINVGISNTKFLEQKLEEAETYLQKAVDIATTFPLKDSSEYLAKIYTNLGNVNSARTNDLEAIKYYKKSHNYYRKTNDKFGISLTAFNIGDVYNYNDMYDSAYKYFNITLDMGHELHNFEELYYAYLGFTELYERQNNYEKALEYQKLKFAYKDSIQIQKYDKAVVELEQQYNAEKKAAELASKEKEVALANQQKEKDQSTIKLLAIGGGVLAILSIALLFLYRRVSNANQVIKEQRNSIDQTLKQKEILLQEVHHRVKNNLQLIASLLNLQLMNLESSPAKRAIEESKSRVQAIALMHKGLYQDENYDAVNLPSYINELVDNLKTLSSSSLKSIDFKVNIESISLDIDKSVPIGLIISELISNSLKHAFVGLESGEINISITRDKDNLLLTYSDNGVGLPDNFNIEEQESLGYTIISALSDQLNGQLIFESLSPLKLLLRF